MNRRGLIKGLAGAIVAGPAAAEAAAKVVPDISVKAVAMPPDTYRCDWVTACVAPIPSHLWDNGEWVRNPKHKDFYCEP